MLDKQENRKKYLKSKRKKERMREESRNER